MTPTFHWCNLRQGSNVGRLQFWHAGEFSELAGDEVVIRWVFNDQGKIVVMGINPKTKAPPVD